MATFAQQFPLTKLVFLKVIPRWLSNNTPPGTTKYAEFPETAFLLSSHAQ